MLAHAWIIAALPLLSFVMIVFFLNRNNKVSSYFSIAMVLTAFLLSCVVLIQVLGDPTPKEYWVNWAVFGDAGMTGAKPISNEPQSAIETQNPETANEAMTESHRDALRQGSSEGERRASSLIPQTAET